MDTVTQAAAVATLRALHQSATARVSDLGPAGPASVAEAHQLQDALVASLGEDVAGWKVAGTDPATIMRGAILASRMKQSGSIISRQDAPLLGIEAEVAFRIERDVPARTNWTRDTLAPYVTALPAIEIVASRFADYHSAPLLHRLADLMSNGFLIVGTPLPDWQVLDLSGIAADLSFDGKSVASGPGGHASGNPFLPLLALANSGSVLLRAGQVVTTGTYTGLLYGKPGMQVTASFTGLGTVQVRVAHA